MFHFMQFMSPGQRLLLDVVIRSKCNANDRFFNDDKAFKKFQKADTFLNN